jgi:cytochrome P450
MKRDPIGFISGLAHDYGDIAHMRLLSLPAFVVSHPDYAKHILLDNHQNYGRNSVTHKTIRSVVGYGLATNDGESWLHQRRLMQPTFHHKRILSFGTQMTEATLAMLERWQRGAGQDQPLDILEQMHRLTLRIVGQTLFHIDLSDEANPTGQAFKTVFRLMTDYFYLPFPPLSVPTPRNLRLKAALRTLDEVVYGIICARRGQNAGPVDLLSMLLEAQDEETGEQMNDRQVRDEIMTVLLAGQETSATTLTWTCYLLSQHPDAEQRLSAELESVLGGRPPTVEDLDKLSYTQMLIKETMRLYPAAWSIPRHAIHEDEIGGYSIPANSLMWISLYTTHRHPGFWEDPEVFDPERFTPEREASRPRFAYFPFGGGPHLCIGNSFAMMETQLLIAAIAQRYRLRMVPGHEVKLTAVPTLQPVNGLPMTLHER